MEFMQSGPEIVRSDHQRWLLDYWASQRGSGTLPTWRGLNANDFALPFDNLAWMEVVDVDGAARFRVGFHGARLAKALGPVDCVGKFIDDVLPPAYVGPALSTYWKVMSTKGPVYTVSDMRDPAGRIVHHERLLLPFGLGGSETERILVSVEASSPEGPFELQNLMRSPTRPPVIALCSTIQY
jgi:hypothetical protein